MGKHLVTIATFDQPTPARLVKSVLDEAGILTTVSDETLATDGVSSNAAGRVKVQVLEKDAERAVAVLAEHFGNDRARQLAAQNEAAAAVLDLSTIFRHNFGL